MVKTTPSRDAESVYSQLKSISGEVVPYRQIFDQFSSIVPFSQVLMLSSLPRGSMQIAQPPKLPEPLVRNYGKGLHAHDRLSWQAVIRSRTVRAQEAWPAGQLESSTYFSEFMQPSGLAYAVAAPLTSPAIEGYPGAIHFYRSSTQGDFTEDELQRIQKFALELDAAIKRIRNARRPRSDLGEALPHQAPIRQFIFDANLHPLVPQMDPAVLPERLRRAILDDAKRRLEHLGERDFTSDRVSLPDSRNDLWNFRVVAYRKYPALSDGPVVFFSLQPPCTDWALLRPVDFQADAEVARLIPALKFMREQFHRGPTLVEIAKSVHLSPFHFHRRFTELLGITPKHFMLDCQVHQAKHDLIARKKDLAKIASECGFAHQSHFTSRFKQATGLTPTRWRRMALEARRPVASH